jgi:hypothetical protein
MTARFRTVALAWLCMADVCLPADLETFTAVRPAGEPGR